MSKRILVVEDEDLIAKSISFALRREGLKVELARDGETALASLHDRTADLVVLDIVLAGPLSGFDVCRAIRQESTIPIVMLSARGSDIDKVIGFERGADDYVTKPFAMSELIARIQAHLRRRDYDRTGATSGSHTCGDLTVDLIHHRVTLAGDPVRLTVSEFAVLALLVERPNEPVSREEIVARLWSADFAGETRTCDAHVRRLRSKIERDPRRPERIVTVRGIGYSLVVPAPGAAGDDAGGESRRT